MAERETLLPTDGPWDAGKGDGQGDYTVRKSVTNKGRPLTVFGEADDNTMTQAANCLNAAEGSVGVLCADNHLGYSQPVGMAAAYPDHISVSGVGYDIGCGNKAVKTDLHWDDVKGDVPGIMDEIERRIAFGIGQPNEEEVVDHPVFDAIARAEFKPQSTLLGKARKQLGTVGAGNHYVDLFRDETDHVWVGVHFGSRGFGHTTASGFLAMAQGGNFQDKGVEGEMMGPPVLLHVGSTLGQCYLRAMELAGQYAYAGRDVVCDKVLEILGAGELDSVHNHHNFAWHETHGGVNYWVARKGCTPAFPGQRGFVGATMGEDSVVLRGVDAGLALHSTVHGAGRAMSRTRAAGKQRKRWHCCNRDCDWRQLPSTHKPKDDCCPQCGHNKLQKRWVVEQEGEVDWGAANEELKRRNIVLRGGAADEAPLAYKRLDQVLKAHAGTIEVEERLRPIGVAMAPSNTHDPYKD